ncbi:uncharacterized protein At4g26485-like [Salvia miltiorrhiza]|uniref:uncharacterized protein At4g26485-like n=1 Tax=Salvia miltiorrhiza TaxID=226208 RepID=UPI0025AB91D7|nr:uncharacterized protein At4g26485-like [Salvia miltiorrhiza]XP_057765401.1 uncharacterized protein At4g26485-like [Salvia miltiorrhiza]
MGIQQSVMQTSAIETDEEEENANSSLNWYNSNSGEKSEYNSLGSLDPWQKEREGRWMKHYSSCHRILLVGEGDFSFSTCLASAFGWASNMVATSFDSQAFLVKNYRNALSNLVELRMRKCRVMLEIDATKMATHQLLSGMKFDRIVFNFPFAGFFKGLPREAQIRLHRRLVSGFLENTKEMLSENGEIHITHKSNGFHGEWKLELVAFVHGLRLVEAVDFDKVEWPGYNTKYGFGGDHNFDCNPSITYKFRPFHI